MIRFRVNTKRTWVDMGSARGIAPGASWRDFFLNSQADRGLNAIYHDFRPSAAQGKATKEL
jgi:hypothetical protein